VVGAKYKPMLLPRRKLEEGKRLSKEERREAEKEKLANIPGSEDGCKGISYRAKLEQNLVISVNLAVVRQFVDTI
jgi:hypothetical protein